MSASTPFGPEKKPTLDEAAEKIANDFPNIFANTGERHMLKEDFKLLVRTYVMDGKGLPGYKHTMERRFAQIAAYDRVMNYEAKAKEAGRPSLLEQAKTDAATRTIAEVDNTAQVMEQINTSPELAKRVFGETMAKLMNDMKQK